MKQQQQTNNGECILILQLGDCPALISPSARSAGRRSVSSARSLCARPASPKPTPNIRQPLTKNANSNEILPPKSIFFFYLKIQSQNLLLIHKLSLSLYLALYCQKLIAFCSTITLDLYSPLSLFYTKFFFDTLMHASGHFFLS